MLVSSDNNLLNILLPNDNKVLKDVLKDADVKTLESFKKGTTSVEDILKNLFTDLKTGDKSKANIENILKNSNLFKDLGSFTKSMTSLLSQIENDPALEKYKPLLQNFLKDISSLDDKVLKESLSKSGVFLESKALEQAKGNTNLPKNLENILNEIKNTLKNIPTIEAKKIENLIDKILQNNTKPTGNTSTQNTNTQTQTTNDLKSLVSQLQTLSKGLGDKQLANLTNLTNTLKNVAGEGQLVESKINNVSKPITQAVQQASPQNIQDAMQKVTGKVVETLSQLKNELLVNKNIPNAQNITKQIDTLIQSKDILSKPENLAQVKSLLTQLTSSNEIKTASIQNTNITTLASNINKQSDALSTLGNKLLQTQQAGQQTQTSELLQTKQNVTSKAVDTLTQLKNELLVNRNIPNAQNIIKQIDTVLQSSDLFSKNSSLTEPKNLLTQLTNLNEVKTAATQNPTIGTLVTSLKTQSESITNLESKVLQNQNIQSEKLQLTQNIQQTLSSLKSEITTMNTVDNKLVNQIIDKLLNVQNLFAKIELPLDMKGAQQNLLNQTNSLNNFQNSFSSNINNIILTLKENITSLSSNQNSLDLQQNVFKGLEKLETILNNLIQNPSLLSNRQLQQNPLQSDMKAVLLQMQGDLAGKVDVSSQETLKQVDKMVMQVEYHQLLSMASNSNSVYIPFIWDMLDDGSISMKKTNEEKFFCEINLSLKEFGQTQLLLSLYDKNKLDLTIYASKDSFKQSIRENSIKLKQALNSVDLIPVNINIIDMQKEEDTKETKQSNAYSQNVNLGFGVDIRA